MSDPKTKNPAAPLKNLPPDRFQPKMLIFWLVLVAAVLALLYCSPGMSTHAGDAEDSGCRRAGRGGEHQARSRTGTADDAPGSQRRPRLGHASRGESRKDADATVPDHSARRVALTDANMRASAEDARSSPNSRRRRC